MTKFTARAASAVAMTLLLVLSACTGTDATLGVGNQGEEQLTPEEQAVLPPVAEGTTPVYFLPIVGAPVEKVTVLSRRLSDSAQDNGVTLRPSGANDTVHEVRGYFSAFEDNGAITVVHVWDVFDRQGQRVHRFQGQQNVAASAEDPWAAIPDTTMETIADLVLKDYNQWRTGNSQG